MAEYEVYLTAEAETDLDDIVEYIEYHDSAERADYVCENIRQSILKLEALPGRGRAVPELRQWGFTEFREVLYKPYRILYFVSGERIMVNAIFDGRRGVEELLSRRFLR